ncbi:MAG: OsmC family protein [Vicingaceae bacterium]
MAITRKANAHWKGSAKEGEGKLNSQSDFFQDTPYSFQSRFENEDGKKGTNPEELIAAAHSGCYAMALSVAIGKAGFEPDYLDVDAKVKLEQDDSGFSISQIQLKLEGKVEGMEKDQFIELAEGAKKGCPISKALDAVPIELEASFK